jgi:hypothetical protein
MMNGHIKQYTSPSTKGNTESNKGRATLTSHHQRCLGSSYEHCFGVPSTALHLGCSKCCTRSLGMREDLKNTSSGLGGKLAKEANQDSFAVLCC